MHVGFLQSWLAGGFNEKVVNRIMEMVNRRQPSPDKLKIYITGGASLSCSGFKPACHELQRLKPASDITLTLGPCLKLQCQAFGRLLSQLVFGILLFKCLPVVLYTYLCFEAAA